MQQRNTLTNNPAFYAAPLAPKMRGLTQLSVICALHKHVLLFVTMGSFSAREESLEDEILYKICLYRPYLAWVIARLAPDLSEFQARLCWSSGSWWMLSLGFVTSATCGSMDRPSWPSMLLAESTVLQLGELGVLGQGIPPAWRGLRSSTAIGFRRLSGTTEGCKEFF